MYIVHYTGQEGRTIGLTRTGLYLTLNSCDVSNAVTFQVIWYCTARWTNYTFHHISMSVSRGFFSIRCIVAYSSDIGVCVYNLTLFLFILTILIVVNQMYSYLLYVLCYNKAQTQNLVLSLPSLFDFPLYIHSSILFRWTSCGKDLLHFLWARDLKEDTSYF